jgi:hypothetical protein
MLLTDATAADSTQAVSVLLTYSIRAHYITRARITDIAAYKLCCIDACTHDYKQMAQYMEEQRLKVEAIAASVREDCMAHLAAKENASTVVM